MKHLEPVVERIASRLPAYQWKGQGVLIAFEGIDGAGLSTHSKLLSMVIERVVRGVRICLVKEPSEAVVGSVIRDVLSGREPSLRDQRVLGLLYAADRLHHLYAERVCSGYTVAEALLEGYMVVMDRYKYSSIAYQSTPLNGEPADTKWLWVVNDYAPPAHILVFLDVPVEVALERIGKRSEVQLFEEKARLEMVRERFVKLLEELEERGERPGLWWSWRGGVLQSLYPEAVRVPRVYRIAEVVEGRLRSIEEVGYDVTVTVLNGLEELGIVKKL